MIKGVNKLIVDVANPDSEFFERAIFFVKPAMKDTSSKELNKSADKLIVQASRKRHKAPVPFGITFAGAAGFGAAVAAILIKLVS
jgi:hypothetical protein